MLEGGVPAVPPSPAMVGDVDCSQAASNIAVAAMTDVKMGDVRIRIVCDRIRAAATEFPIALCISCAPSYVVASHTVWMSMPETTTWHELGPVAQFANAQLTHANIGTTKLVRSWVSMRANSRKLRTLHSRPMRRSSSTSGR